MSMGRASNTRSQEPGFASVCEGVGGFRFVNGAWAENRDAVWRPIKRINFLQTGMVGL